LPPMASTLVLPVCRRTSTEGELGASPVLGTCEQMQPERPLAEEAAESGNYMKENVKVTVKNTFIHIDPEDDEVGFHYSGAQTCKARFSDSIPKDMCADDFNQTLQHMQHKTYEDTTRTGTANGFFVPVPKMLAASISPPAFPAPTTLARGALGIQTPGPPAPPPQPSPAPNFGQQLFWLAPCGPAEVMQLQQVGDATGVLMVSSEGGKMEHMQPMMMITTPVVNVQLPEPPGMAQATAPPTSSVGGCAAATAVASPVGLGWASTAPSKGSQLHGQFLDDSQPACQPCVWFYKASGCQNGASCCRCHLCPEGEVRLRKTQKLARFRNAGRSRHSNGQHSNLAGF